jgi:hypothetical protein
VRLAGIFKRKSMARLIIILTEEEKRKITEGKHPAVVIRLPEGMRNPLPLVKSEVYVVSDIEDEV